MTNFSVEPEGWTSAELQNLQSQLDTVPAPFEPLDICALDGFLVGVLLQPQKIEQARWFPYVLDQEGRPLPPKVAASLPLTRLHEVVGRRHAELNRAIALRQWFDPWVFELEPGASAADAVLPWIAGWSAALDVFPALLKSSDPALREPLATLFAYFDPDDLEDVDDLVDLLAEMAPADTLEDAVQDLVRSTLLIADVSRPQSGANAPRKTARRGSSPARRLRTPKR
jgi:uncharacterized protein